MSEVISEDSEAVQVVFDERRLAINEQNHADMLHEISEHLQPGTPVLLQSHETRGFWDHTESTYLFLSDGMSDGKINVQKGKKNRVYLSLHEDESHYIYCSSDREVCHSVELPRDWESSYYNEHTFSPAGGETVHEYNSKGTDRIEIGNHLIAAYPELIGALEFCQDALHFHMPSFYSTLHATIESKGDPRKHSAEARAMMQEITTRECLAYVLGLFRQNSALYKKAAKRNARLPEEDQRDVWAEGHISAHQIGRSYKDGYLARDIYLIAPEDYIIHEYRDGNTRLGYFKHGSGGEGFFLPEYGMETAAKEAFSPENINKYYPQP